MDEHRYAAAARRVDKVAGLVVHALAFLVVNALLFTQAGFRPGAGHFWGWGIGLTAHALAVLGPGSQARQRLIRWQLDADDEPAPR